jgi:hypothetical protein
VQPNYNEDELRLIEMVKEKRKNNEELTVEERIADL